MTYCRCIGKKSVFTLFLVIHGCVFGPMPSGIWMAIQRLDLLWYQTWDKRYLDLFVDTAMFHNSLAPLRAIYILEQRIHTSNARHYHNGTI